MAEIRGRGPWLSTATALFFSWAFMFFGVRFWVMLGRKQNWSLSDSTITVGFVWSSGLARRAKDRPLTSLRSS
jgi:hypothetical protein